MSKKNLLSKRDKELQELAKKYEAAKAEGRTIYLDADDLADLADWYATRDNYQMATEVVEYGLSLHPENTALMIQKAYILMDTQNSEQAQEIADAIQDDYSTEVKILKAHLLLDEDKEDDAEQLLDTIEDKDDLANIVDVAYMYIDMGYPEKASLWVNYGSEKYAEDEAYIAVTADCLFTQGLIEEAIPLYNKLIDKDPYAPTYWFGLARCYFEQQVFDKAIQACDYAIVANEDFAEAYLMKGHAYFQLGNEDSALENYIIAQKYKVVSSEFVYMFIGMNKISKGEWEGGYQNLEKAIQSEDVNTLILPSLYANAAFCLYRMGKRRKAHQYCRKGAELDPNEVDPYLVEGRIYMEDGYIEKAVKKWAIALERAPYADTWFEIAMFCMEASELSYAKVAFEHVKELEPDFPQINERLATLYMILQDKENYHKYNKLCKHPVTIDDLEKLERILDIDDKEELEELMKNISKILK